ITPAIEGVAGKPSSWRSKGGMKTKIEAARISMMSNCSMVIANALERDIITRIVEGEEIGTVFRPENARHSSKKKWIRHSISSGSVAVNPTAAEALLKGSGLLPLGVVTVEGEFEA